MQKFKDKKYIIYPEETFKISWEYFMTV